MKTEYAAENRNSAPFEGSGMLYGMSTVWLMDALRDLPTSTKYGSILLLIFAGVACISLVWVLSLRKRLAGFQRLAASEGERYRQFFADCPDALLVVEEDGSIVSANPHAHKLLQMEAPELLAHTCFEFIEKISLIEFRKQFHLCLAGKPLHCESDILVEGGSLIPIEVNGRLQRIEDKNLIQLYIRDKRVQRETEEQVHSLYNHLEKANAKLEEKKNARAAQLEQERREMLNSLNHNIRTPLNGIMGMGQLLSDSRLDIEQHSQINTILISATNLLNVIENLENITEISSAEPMPEDELHPVAFNVHASGFLEDIRVLVVDDNKVSQRIVVAMLHKVGAHVISANNGEEAIARIEEQTFDVVLMDCQMPVMDGYAATEFIRSMTSPECSLPVIALTAHSLKHELDACRNCGMDDYLIKPIERRILIDTVAQYAKTGRNETAALKLKAS